MISGIYGRTVVMMIVMVGRMVVMVVMVMMMVITSLETITPSFSLGAISPSFFLLSLLQ